MNLRFAQFREEDFPEYQSWFNDVELNMRLGPMDAEWLKHILQETSSCEYSVFCGNELVAVVGITFPNADHAEYVISDFAIKPSLRNAGIGSLVLERLLKVHVLKPNESWIAFIDIKNPRAKNFFEKNGWLCESEQSDEHGMLTMKLKT